MSMHRYASRANGPAAAINAALKIGVLWCLESSFIKKSIVNALKRLISGRSALSNRSKLGMAVRLCEVPRIQRYDSAIRRRFDHSQSMNGAEGQAYNGDGNGVVCLTTRLYTDVLLRSSSECNTRRVCIQHL